MAKKRKSKRVALYVRVSTTNGQTTENQRRELKAWAAAAGHQVVEVYEDAGVSGAAGRDKRPRFDAMLKGAVRREFDMLAVWSVDRMGRSLQDLIGCLNELHAAGIDLYIHRQALDTTTPAGKAMFGMLGIFAEFEREIIRERVHAGLARAREQGRVGGRPPVPPAKIARVRRLLADGASVRKTAKAVGVAPSTVSKIKAADVAAGGD
jgi:DNA invertase Pin-like site-specific DNA recombinase